MPEMTAILSYPAAAAICQSGVIRDIALDGSLHLLHGLHLLRPAHQLPAEAHVLAVLHPRLGLCGGLPPTARLRGNTKDPRCCYESAKFEINANQRRTMIASIAGVLAAPSLFPGMTAATSWP